MSKGKQETLPEFPAGKVIDGRYRVVRLIGQGGNGYVHEVEHVLTGGRLALKTLLDESASGRLEQEARAASLMKNRHVVRVTDMGKLPDIGPYLVMELLEGQSLRDMLETSGTLDITSTANIALQVCECLAEAHTQGLVHRDLKPDNIYVSASPHAGLDVKVLDFGVVKVGGDGPIPNNSLTRTGSTVGTPFYMSLEQLRNSSNVDARSDLYSLCVVLYECLSGKKPYHADTIGDLVYALCSGPAESLGTHRPDVPESLEKTIMSGLSSNRDERPASMQLLAAAFAPFGDSAFAAWLGEKSAQRTSPPSGGRAISGTSMPQQPPPHQPPEHQPPAPDRDGPAPPRPRSVASTGGAASTFGGAVPTAPPRPPSAKVSVKPPAPPRPPGAADAPRALDLPMSDLNSDADTPEDTSDANFKTATHPVVNETPARPGEAPPLRHDRDTPTEMYLKGVHGDGFSDAVAQATDDETTNTQRETPTEALDIAEVQAKLDAARAEPGQSAKGDGTLRIESPFSEAAISSQDVPAQRLSAPEPSMSASDELPQTLGAKTQFALDRALSVTGSFFESTTHRASTWFRQSSPTAQIVIVVVGASVVASLLVLLLYFALGSSSAPPTAPPGT